MKKRKVHPGEVHHICQMTEGKGLLFYSIQDYLVFFTVFCTLALRMGVQILALCPMPDHIHCALVAPNARKLAVFVQQYSRLFAHLWNQARQLKGNVFHHNYASSVKLGNKHVRTVLAYVNNNPVERKLCERAEEYRWNFLKYRTDPHPYSAAGNEAEYAKRLRTAMQMVRVFHQQGKYLGYNQLNRLYKCLSPGECQQLTDYIVRLWNVIDYQEAISYYGSGEAMERAFHDNTGSDYDIREERDPYSDTVYMDCIRILLKDGFIGSVFEIPALPDSRKQELFHILRIRTAARPRQLAKLLRITGA